MPRPKPGNHASTTLGNHASTTRGNHASTTLGNHTSHVQIKVYDIPGRKIVTLVDDYKEAGSYEVMFNASSVSQRIASGVYVYRLTTDNIALSKKMLYLK